MNTDVIETLKLRQQAAGESDQAFAARIGVSGEMWRLVRLGRAKPGRRTLRGIGQAFPDLQFQIATSLFLADDMAIPKVEA